MARKKQKIEPIIGLGENPETDLTVQKSKPLLGLWRSDFTLPEFKIIDTYLSRIDSHKPDNRTVIFRKGELEHLLGVTRINKAQLTQRLNDLGRFVELETENDRKIHKIALFEEAYGELDEDGIWQIKLTCTPTALKYIFNIEELGYLRYKIRSVIPLASKYAYLLFVYLEKNRFRTPWEEDVDVLRRVLACDKDESYSSFKVFNDRVLKRAQKELREKTECKFTYELIKSGRKIVKIRFRLETLAMLAPADPIDPDQLTLFADHLVMLRDVFTAYAMPDTDLETIYQHLITLPESSLPLDPGGSGDLIAKQTQYLRIIAAKMARSRKEIPHPCNYICKIISNDAQKAAEAAAKTPKPALPFGDAGTNLGTFERDAIARLIAQEKAEAEAEE